MKKILVLLPAVLLLATAAYAAKDAKGCYQANPYFGAKKCPGKKDVKPFKTQQKAYYGAEKACPCTAKAECGKKGCPADVKKGAKACKTCPSFKAKMMKKKAAKMNCECNPFKNVPCKKAAAPKPVVRPAAPRPAPRPTASEDLSKVATVQQTATGATRVSFNHPILFATNSDRIQSGEDEVAKIATVLKNHPDSQIVVEGYSDSTGNAAYNVDLSERRAKAVAKVLVDNGVKAENVSAKGYGPVNFIAPNNTAAGRAKNRRVELDITTK
ncbi:Outer membrane protein OmpA [Parelusimicrobium proximum]|uniref:OmpA family protein n=1 Tax=Parelusimicrobium proximum TaxID=3228953 RepID=UPI003D16A223